MSEESCQECGRVVPHPEPLFLVDKQTRMVCRECNDVLRPPCPYCGQPLEKRPKQKKKCPHCNRPIFVRSAQKLFPTDLLTEQQANEVDELMSGALWRFDLEGISHTFTKVAGTSRRNANGTSRQSIIRKCQPFEKLVLDHESDNPHDPNATAVHRETGGQLGYLNAELAQAVVVLSNRGFRFAVFLTQITGDGPKGANLLIISGPPGTRDSDVQQYANHISGI